MFHDRSFHAARPDRPQAVRVNASAYPRWSYNAHWFNFYNAISFQIMMGAPIILFAKSLGASSTVLGVLAAFTPLMTVFQLPAARFLDRTTYRNFVLAGWGPRVVLIFGVACVPLLGFLEPASKIALLLGMLFVFNLLRGITSAAWMPWMTAIIPEEFRGRFLSLDQIFLHVGCLISLVVSAALMAGDVQAWEYSLVFLVSAVGGAVSLWFIRGIPVVASTETLSRSSAPVPWKAMLQHPPFRSLLEFNALYTLVLGSLGVFSIEFLRGVAGMDPSIVLILSALAFLGALATLPFCGRVLDSIGSKPVMRLAVAGMAAVIAGWFLTASGVIPAVVGTVAVLNLATGAAGASFNVANARVVMATMPEMGRNHFFALFSVITSLGLGSAPIVWGLALDALGTFEIVTGALTWKRHSIYFLALLLLAFASLALVNRLDESGSQRPPRPDLLYARLRRWLSNWHR